MGQFYLLYLEISKLKSLISQKFLYQCYAYTIMSKIPTFALYFCNISGQENSFENKTNIV